MDLDFDTAVYSPCFDFWLNAAHMDVHQLCTDYCAYAATQDFNARECTLLVKQVPKLVTMVRH